MTSTQLAEVLAAHRALVDAIVSGLQFALEDPHEALGDSPFPFVASHLAGPLTAPTHAPGRIVYSFEGAIDLTALAEVMLVLLPHEGRHRD